MKARWLAAALCILLMAVVFAPALGEARWLAELHDFAHGPIFGAVALLALLLLRRSARFARLPRLAQYAIVGGVAGVLGLATEVAQIPAGRDASWSDVVHDVIGAGAVLALYAPFDPTGRMRLGARSAAVLLGIILVGILTAPLARSALAYHARRASFPVLADFTHGVDRYFIWRHEITLEFAPVPAALRARPDEGAAHIRFLAGEYPGVEFHEPAADWRGYQALALDLANPGPNPLTLVLRVHDEQHDNRFVDRYNQAFTIAPLERRVIRVALSDIERAPQGRRLDLQRVAGVILFRAEPPGEEMYVSRMWLE